jgi:hypothetical protein
MPAIFFRKLAKRKRFYSLRFNKIALAILFGRFAATFNKSEAFMLSYK